MSSRTNGTRAASPATNGSKRFQQRESQFTLKQCLAALGALDLLYEGSLLGCPQCRAEASEPYTPKAGKVRAFDDGGLKCRKCGFWARDPRRILATGEFTAEEVQMILAHPDEFIGNFKVADVVRPDTVCDPEVYEALLSYASVEAAVKFYGRFGISEQVVRNSGTAVLTRRADEVLALLVEEFSHERVLLSGVLSSRGTLLCNYEYPVIEPQHSLDGRVVGLQFRGSVATERRVAAHKRGEAPYKAKFYALVGPPEGSRPGFGLHLVAGLPAGTRVAITEGFKDVLASWTMGVPAIGIPGAGCPISPAALELLRDKVAVVCFDGDQAGENGAESLSASLQRAGVETLRCTLPDGTDVTDILTRSRTASAANSK